MLYVNPITHDFLSSVEHKRKYFGKCLHAKTVNRIQSQCCLSPIDFNCMDKTFEKTKYLILCSTE